MQIRALRTLVAIDRLGAFSTAAEDVSLTLSAVSMQMKGLEAALGCALFDRAFRPPRLTPVGRQVAAAAARVLEAEAALLEAAQGGGLLNGEYRIGFVLTASVRVLPGFLARASEAAPKARFRVETGLSEDLIARVGAGALDAAVVTLVDPLPRAYGVVRLAHEEIVFAVPQGRADAPLATCMAELAFLHFMPETGIGRVIARHLSEAGLVPAHVVELDGIEATVECVRAGVGFTALPQPDLLRYGGGALALRRADPPLGRDLALVTRSDGATGLRRAELAALMAAPGPGRDAAG